MDIQKFIKSEVIMKHTKMTALLCTLALSSCISATAAPQAGSTPLDPYRAAVQKMKDLEKAEKKGEQSAPASAPAAAAPAGDVNYTDALLKGLDLTVADVQASVESGTFKNLSPEAPKPVVEQPAAEPEPAEEPEPETEPEPVSPPVKNTPSARAKQPMSSPATGTMKMEFTPLTKQMRMLSVSPWHTLPPPTHRLQKQVILPM